MATVYILGVNKAVVDRLMNIRHICHVTFYDEYLFNKAVSLGFDKVAWENKNNNKVIVKKMSTLGEQRVRVDFNVTKDTLVDQIKIKSAGLIDLMQTIKNDEVSKTYESSASQLQATSGEKLRLIALAQTAYEEAAMWAVKAATL